MKKIYALILLLSLVLGCVSVNKRESIPFEEINNAKKLDEFTLRKYVISAPTVTRSPNVGSPFDTLSYNKVIAYDFDGRHERNKVIGRFGLFQEVLKQQYLTQEQTDKLLKSLTKKSSYGETPFSCFEPHFAVVFYKGNKMVNQLNVCLDCNDMESEIEISAQYANKVKFDDTTYYELRGFSKKGRKAITSLCKELDFLYGLY